MQGSAVPFGGTMTRIGVFLSEDDRVGRRLVVDVLVDRAREASMAGATVWRGVEGFGPSGHVRSDRFPDAGRGLPMMVELVDERSRIDAFLDVVRQLAPDALVVRDVVNVVGH